MDSVGRAARHRLLLVVECRHCRHVGHHRATDVAKVAGFNKPLEAVRFKCSRCGRKDVEVRTQLIDIDRPPKVHVWTLTRFRP